MTVRVDVAPSVLSWTLDVTSADEEALHRRFKIDPWLNAETRPTLRQLQDFTTAVGVPFGYLLLAQPPSWIPDVCSAHGVAWTDPFKLYRALGMRLVA